MTLSDLHGQSSICNKILWESIRTNCFRKSISNLSQYGDKKTGIILVDRSNKIRNLMPFLIDSIKYKVSHSSEYDSVDVAHINYLVYTNKINEYANIVVIYKFEKKGNIYVIGFWRPIDGGHARIEYSYRKKKLSILAHECGAI